MLRRSIVLVASAVILVGCSTEDNTPASFEVTAPLFAQGGNAGNNVALHLTGHEEVLAVAPGAPHPSDSRAQGQANFRIDGNIVVFKLMASNIDNINQAHIHCGRVGENGPVRMWLYPVIGASGAAGPNASGPHDGILASGTFNATGVICPAANVGVDMPLIEAMRAGLTYVNVHTNDGVAPINTGPGDFPGGELRGQVPSTD